MKDESPFDVSHDLLDDCPRPRTTKVEWCFQRQFWKVQVSSSSFTDQWEVATTASYLGKSQSREKMQGRDAGKSLNDDCRDPAQKVSQWLQTMSHGSGITYD